MLGIGIDVRCHVILMMGNCLAALITQMGELFCVRWISSIRKRKLMSTGVSMTLPIWIVEFLISSG